jgi:hypothetical protein
MRRPDYLSSASAKVLNVAATGTNSWKKRPRISYGFTAPAARRSDSASQGCRENNIMSPSVALALRRSCGATIAALFVATVTSLPAAFAQPLPPGNPQQSSAMAVKMGAPGSTSTMPSDLPGFPGASHIYHVGATGFFLDYSAALKLTADQQAALKRIREESIGDMGAEQQRIDQAEQELWMLTDSDRPDSMALERKVRDIEKLKGDQRIAFIRSVGEAARVLTDGQRAALPGPGAPAGAKMALPQASGGSTNPPPGMGSTDSKAGMTGMGDESIGNMGTTKTPNAKPNGGMGDM